MSERYNFVSRDLVRQWSEDGERVNWCNPFRKESRYASLPEDLFCFDYPYVPGKENIRRYESYMRLTISMLKSGNISFFRSENIAGRDSLLFQYMRTPTYHKLDFAHYGKSGDVSYLNRHRGYDFFSEEDDWDLSVAFMKEKILPWIEDLSISFLDLETVLLHAPEGKNFILGAHPVNVFNPFFEKRFVKFSYAYKLYDICGATIVMPVTPSLLLCLIDRNIYGLKAKCKDILLTENDVDILNMIQLYNADRDGGVVYKDDEEYLYALTKRLGSTPYRDAIMWQKGYAFPFEVSLSFFDVKDGAQKLLSKFIKNPVRPFVVAMNGYFEEKGMVNSGNNMIEKINERHIYAENVLKRFQLLSREG